MRNFLEKTRDYGVLRIIRFLSVAGCLNRGPHQNRLFRVKLGQNERFSSQIGQNERFRKLNRMLFFAAITILFFATLIQVGGPQVYYIWVPPKNWTSDIINDSMLLKMVNGSCSVRQGGFCYAQEG